VRQDESHFAPVAARDGNVTPFPQRQRHSPRPAGYDSDRDDGGPSAPGFGDHLPAFLARKPRVAG
jgi:hypothetical protein